jgi:hypothetical protein
MLFRNLLNIPLIALLTALLYYVPVSSFAQKNDSPFYLTLHNEIGFESSSSMSPEYTDFETNANIGFDFSLGLALNYFPTSNLSFNIGPSITRKSAGYEMFDSLDYSVADYTFTTTALQIPLVMRIGSFFYAGIGGYTSFIITNPTWKDSYGDSSDEEASGEIPDEYYNKMDYGLILEAGFMFKYFEFGFRYEHGLVNIINTPVEKYKVRSMLMTLGVRFQITDN